jgi:probable rRNA maturation factor
MPLRITVDVPRGSAAGTTKPALLRTKLARAARTALQTISVTDAEISVALQDDAAISAMNRKYLEHDGPTDVISFALHDDGDSPLGDIYIGYEQALRQAKALDVLPDEELMRLTVHGVLHVLGYEHPDGEERLQSEMWTLQEQIMTRLEEG